MEDKKIFKRYEMKYMLTAEQKDRLLRKMRPYMKLDEFGRSSIRSIYFDTDNWRLIRSSIEKPVYKEKLRVRSYGLAGSDSKVFVELKKKYDSVVYKRRISMTEKEAMDWLCIGGKCCKDTQISREIDYFLHFYQGLRPAVFISYEREAYYMLDGSDFRVTFDDNILGRENDLSLQKDVGGHRILPEGMVLMELKASAALPLWMTEFLTQEHLYKTSFSKYGTLYKEVIFPECMADYRRSRVYRHTYERRPVRVFNKMKGDRVYA